MPDLDPRALQKLAEKNREKSLKEHEKDATSPRSSRKGPSGPLPDEDPRYEGADRLFKEMKRRRKD